MLPLAIYGLVTAALGGGGYALWRRRKHAAASGPITSKPLDEFLEIRSDGLQQFNRHTAISILGWLASVSLEDRQAPEGAHVYELITSGDGMPPPADSKIAGRTLVSAARAGSVVLVTTSVTTTGRMARRAMTLDPRNGTLLREAAKKGAPYAILIVPVAEPVEVAELPPMPGFDGQKDVPGATKLPPAVTNTGAELPNDLREQLDEAIKRAGSDPEALAAIATQLRLGGHAREAEIFEKRAADVHALGVVAKLQRGEAFVIPTGHPGAIALARKITGDPSRVRDLLAQNPALGLDGDRVVPWTPGQVVTIPPSWRSR